MCLIIFANAATPRYPLIVAANRDEAYARPATPASFWSDHSEVFGGRDLEQGGTWLGITTSGRFAAVTNYRQAPAVHPAPRSRGELTRGYLTGALRPEHYLGAVQARAEEYRGFSLIVGAPGELYFCSNRGGAVARITPGVHGLSNHLLDEPWPKVLRGITVLSGLLDATEDELLAGLFEMLADRARAPERLLPETRGAIERERDLSSAFISGEVYGTRASTVILVRAHGEVVFMERSFGPHGVARGTVEQRFRLQPPAHPLTGDPVSSASSIAR
jgi:uncharacterized protein with NRDE domain